MQKWEMICYFEITFIFSFRPPNVGRKHNVGKCISCRLNYCNVPLISQDRNKEDITPVLCDCLPVCFEMSIHIWLLFCRHKSVSLRPSCSWGICHTLWSTVSGFLLFPLSYIVVSKEEICWDTVLFSPLLPPSAGLGHTLVGYLGFIVSIVRHEGKILLKFQNKSPLIIYMWI